MNKEAFLNLFRDGASRPATPSTVGSGVSGFDGFDFFDDIAEGETSSFARAIVEDVLSYGERVPSERVGSGSLPDPTYWPKTPTRGFFTLLFEAEESELSFRGNLEDALIRFVRKALYDFSKNGRPADHLRGMQTETVCIIAVGNLVCFGTQNMIPRDNWTELDAFIIRDALA